MKSTSLEEEITTELCCKDMQQFYEKVVWFEYIDKKTNKTIETMPCWIGIDSSPYRFNYCPFCGKYIRNIRYVKKDSK